MAPHPFDPVTPAELRLAVKILENAFPGVALRYKVIDLQEPIKKDVVPYIEAERLCVSLPKKPARLLMAMFHRLDTKSFMKALINIDTRVLLHVKEIPKDIQVSPGHQSELKILQ